MGMRKLVRNHGRVGEAMDLVMGGGLGIPSSAEGARRETEME